MIHNHDLLIIVAALTERLGGEVHLPWQELIAVPDVDIYRQLDPAGEVLVRLHRPTRPEVLHAEVIRVGDPAVELPA
jgi:hypothetical protein